MRLLSLVAIAAIASFSVAHPGHNVQGEMEERAAALKGLPRDFSHCAEKMKARGITAEAAARRARVAREFREARGLDTGE